MRPVMAICVRVILVRPDKNPRKIWSGGPKSLTKLSRYFGPGGPKSTTCCVLCDSISSNETSKRKRLQTRRVSLSEQALIQSMQVFSKQLVFLLQQLVQCTCTLCYYNPWFCCLHASVVLLLACFYSSAACMLPWFCCLHASVLMLVCFHGSAASTSIVLLPCYRGSAASTRPWFCCLHASISSAACMLWFCCLHDTVFVMLPYGSTARIRAVICIIAC